MFKTILILVLIAFIVAFFVDPDALTSWRDAAGHAGGAITHVVKVTGEATNNVVKKY